MTTPGPSEAERDRLTEPWLEADEVASEQGRCGWVARDLYPDAAEAEAFARTRMYGSPERLHLTPVLMREESEVEANINGHEFPMYVECTARAKRPLPYWRVEGSDG